MRISAHSLIHSLSLLLFVSVVGLLTSGITPVSSTHLDGRLSRAGGSTGPSNKESAEAGHAARRGSHSHPRVQVSGPPVGYRALVQRPIGRYFLAASSLVGECVRVYAPVPFSSVCTRVDTLLHNPRRSIERPDGEMNSRPGMSYAKFMYADERSDDEDGSGEVLLAPLEKYGRVSSCFLMRHGIARAGPSAAATCRIDRSDASVPASSNRPNVSMFKENSPRETAGRNFAFRSLSSLKRSGRRQIQDDLDLLSDVEQDESTSDLTSRGGKLFTDEGLAEDTQENRREPGLTGRNDVRNHHETFRMSSQFCDEVEPNGGENGVRGARPSPRNLVDCADDTATALVRKLRRATEERNTK